VTGHPFAPVSLATLTDEALHLIHLARSGEDIRYHNRCPAGLEVKGDAQRLLQVMVNLLGNARDASTPGGEVVIDAAPEGEWLHVTVTDQGHGIDERVRDHLFEPFTTTKPPGEGTGLGLPLVYSIIAEHGGQIDIDSPPPGQAHGTRIHLWLPLNSEHGTRTDEPDPDR
jgi:signal transduction histidine kinase